MLQWPCGCRELTVWYACDLVRTGQASNGNLAINVQMCKNATRIHNLRTIFGNISTYVCCTVIGRPKKDAHAGTVQCQLHYFFIQIVEAVKPVNPYENLMEVACLRSKKERYGQFMGSIDTCRPHQSEAILISDQSDVRYLIVHDQKEIFFITGSGST